MAEERTYTDTETSSAPSEGATSRSVLVSESPEQPDRSGPRRSWKGNALLWTLCVIVWFAFDRVTKVFFDENFTPGDVVVSNIAGLFQFDLVHNRGVARGAFAGEIPLIVVLTAVVCVLILAFSLYWARSASRTEMVALGLLFAGGIGNLFDRVTLGYVVDFITPIFIDFPTFNIADIGVTCGVILLAIVWVVQIVREGKKE